MISTDGEIPKGKGVRSLEITWKNRDFSFGISAKENLNFSNGELVSITPLKVKQGNFTEWQLNKTNRKHILPKNTRVS